MHLSQVAALLALPAFAYSFLPHATHSARRVALRSPHNNVDKEVSLSQPWSNDECSFTQLNMAFDDSNPSNMFDGPMALTKERDACGVGFIANTQSGGRYEYLSSGKLEEPMSIFSIFM
jgi:glutamate synthase (ferredoxin)